MLKKNLVALLFFVIHSSDIISMKIDYDRFFKLCKEGDFWAVTKFIDKNRTTNANYKEQLHGETPLLRAASNNGIGNTNIANYLLEKCNADKMIQNNYGQTLFSKAVAYWDDYALEFLFETYSDDEINVLCRSIKLDNKWRYEDSDSSVNSFVVEVLEGKRDINSKQDNVFSNTAFHYAYMHGHVPFAIQLLERGANLYEKDKFQKTPDFYLRTKNQSNANLILFTLREAFNTCVPAALVGEVLTENVDNDTVHLIKQFYIESL